ncbi:MAG: hypothetical protein JXO72_13700, partial [Vicinamibacteria bacterium]|nr:hypothetical protein [Vicinamibacteria bacterium]
MSFLPEVTASAVFFMAAAGPRGIAVQDCRVLPSREQLPPDEAGGAGAPVKRRVSIRVLSRVTRARPRSTLAI